MNIKKTNPKGIFLIESRFDVLRNLIKDVIKKENVDKPKNTGWFLNPNIGQFEKNTKILRISKTVIENSKLINLESILSNINVADFDFTSLVILLDKDSSGIIKVVRSGTDFTFLYLKNLDFVNSEKCCLNSYSFLTKEFNFEKEKESSEFVIKILAYLYYGDLKTQFTKPKQRIKLSSFTKFLNNSSLNLTYVDTLWRKRICTDGFNVSGHFRLQPIGEGRKKRKLIWIEEFKKDGYNRKATVELQK